MDSDQITCCLSYLLRYSKFKKIYVIARDELKFVNLSLLPVAIVINTDISTGPGIHWCGFNVFRHNGQIVARFFDSYNNLPEKYLFKPTFKIIETSSKTLQSSSTSNCGIWVIAWLHAQSRGLTTRQFQSKYSNNLVQNDISILKHYKKIIKPSSLNSLSCCPRCINNL